MARLLIYDAYENKVYTYANLNENDPMPYSTGTTLRVREFRGKSASPTLWTTIAAMEAWNLTRRKYRRLRQGRGPHMCGPYNAAGLFTSAMPGPALLANRPTRQCPRPSGHRSG